MVVVAVVANVVVLVVLLELLKLLSCLGFYRFYCYCTDTSKVSQKIQNPQFLTQLTSKCSSRHNCVHFFDFESPSNPRKVVGTPRALCIFTCTCASRHNRLHFFDIATSKKWSEHGVFCAFLLPNLLRATTARTFSTSARPKVVRTRCVLPLFTFKCAWRHNGAQFFHISTSKSGPTLACFDAFDFKMCFAAQRRAILNLSSGQLAPHPPL